MSNTYKSTKDKKPKVRYSKCERTDVKRQLKDISLNCEEKIKNKRNEHDDI